MTPEQFHQWCDITLIKTANDVKAFIAMHHRKLGKIPTELRVSPEQFQRIADDIAPGQRIEEISVKGVRINKEARNG